jgi:hypothetical protein
LLVIVHGSHEFDLGVVVITLASRWVDVSSTLLFTSWIFHHAGVQRFGVAAATFSGAVSPIKRNDFLVSNGFGGREVTGRLCHSNRFPDDLESE